jgi:hypothetical protein
MAPKKLRKSGTVFVHNVVFATTVLMLLLICSLEFAIIYLSVGLISFDVGIFTGYARRPEVNVRFHQVTSNGNFVAKVKAAFSGLQLAPAYA